METDWLHYALPMDRRQKKTRVAVEKALLTLMQEKPLEQITIQELAQRADINRKTFYNNYNTIEDVLQGIEQKISAFLFDKLPPKITIQNEIEIYHLFVDVTASVEPHKQILCQMAKNCSATAITQRLKEQILPYIQKSLSAYHIAPAIIPYINSYVVNGVFSIYYEWLSDEQLTAQQVALLGYNLTASAIRLDNYRDIFPADR